MALTNTPLRLTEGPNYGGAAGRPMERYTEGASQTYTDNAFVILSSGKAIESTSPLSSTNKTIGSANGKATGVTDSEVLVKVPSPDQLFEMTLSDSTAGTHTLAITDIGLIYPVTKDTGSPTVAKRGNWYLDANATSTDGGYVIRNISPIGTVDGRVLCKLTRPAVLGG